MLLLSEPAAALELDPEMKFASLGQLFFGNMHRLSRPSGKHLGVLLLSEPAAALELDPKMKFASLG